MDIQAYEQIARADRVHWWWRARREIVVRVLRRRGAVGPTLNVGAGAGADSRALEALAGLGPVVSTDLSPEALAWAARSGTPRLARSDATALPFPDGCFGTVLALDVVEHVADHRRALAELARVLRPGGLLLVTVPAYAWLWSAHDDVVHHQRRYTRASLLAAVPEGLRVEHTSYFNTLLFPAVAGVRAFKKLLGSTESDLAVPPGPLNRVLRWVFRLERGPVAGPGLPFGVSLLGLFRKP